MNLEQAIEKIAALEKRIEELEKRPAVVINNNHPQPWYYTYQITPTTAPEPSYIGDAPFHGPTCAAPRN